MWAPIVGHTTDSRGRVVPRGRHGAAEDIGSARIANLDRLTTWVEAEETAAAPPARRERYAPGSVRYRREARDLHAADQQVVLGVGGEAADPHFEASARAARSHDRSASRGGSAGGSEHDFLALCEPRRRVQKHDGDSSRGDHHHSNHYSHRFLQVCSGPLRSKLGVARCVPCERSGRDTGSGGGEAPGLGPWPRARWGKRPVRGRPASNRQRPNYGCATDG